MQVIATKKPAGVSLATARMAVSRHAATLFWERGVADTSGDDIAAAAGLSKRTVWRYFRTKESCVEPLLSASAYRFMESLERWPRAESFEEFLIRDLAAHPPTPLEVSDDIGSMRIISMTPDEPALRAAWLMVCGQAERTLVPILARRLDRDVDDFDIRLGAAAAAAAVRVVNEAISVAALSRARAYTIQDVIRELGAAIRASSRLPICDPQPVTGG